MTDTEIQAVKLITQGAELMGWLIAIDTAKKDEPVQGLIIGTEKFVNQTFSPKAGQVPSKES